MQRAHIKSSYLNCSLVFSPPSPCSALGSWQKWHRSVECHKWCSMYNWVSTQTNYAFIALLRPGNYCTLLCLHFMHSVLKRTQYNQSFSSLRDQLSILTWLINPLNIYFLLRAQNINIRLFYNERFAPEEGGSLADFLNPLQAEYGNIPQTVLHGLSIRMIVLCSSVVHFDPCSWACTMLSCCKNIYLNKVIQIEAKSRTVN